MVIKAGTVVKVTPPKLSNCSRRVRLFRLLDTNRKHPVIWIAGPAGSGKTTLARSYIEHLQLPCLWYRIDAGDADPASFFYYLGMAAQQAAPRLRKTFPLLTREYLPGLASFASRFFEVLYNRLNLPTVMVLDNYQDVSEDAPLHALLRQGLENMPQQMRVFLVSRTQPPVALSRLRANGFMGMLEWEDLRLTLEETGEIASLRKDGTLSTRMLRRLHQQADGWVAGLALLLETPGPASMAMHPSDPETMMEVFDYFAGEVFDHSPKDLQTFMLNTAFLPDFDLEMACEVTGNPRARSLLSILVRKNYFITRHVRKKTLYSYHPLFRAFIKSKAMEMLPDETLIRLQQKTAVTLQRAGRIDAAVKLWGALERWDEVVKIILQHGRALLDMGRLQLVASWLNQLPDDIVQNSPWLLLFKSFCRQPLDPDQAANLAADAYHMFKSQGDVNGKLQAWASVVLSIAFAMGGYRAMDGWIDEFESTKKEFESLTSIEIKVKVASSLFAALTFRRPRHPEILGWADKAISLADALVDINEQIKTRFQAVWYHVTYTGNSIEAGGHLDQMQVLVRSRRASPMAQALACLAECRFYLLFSQPQMAIAACTKGLQLSSKTSLTFLDNTVRGYLAQCHLEIGSLREAADQIRLTEESIGQANLLAKFMLNFTAIRYLLMQGKVGQADLMVRHNRELKGLLGLCYCNTLFDVQQAQVLDMQGKYQEALSCIRRSLQNLQGVGGSYLTGCILLEKANIELGQGDDGAGLASLRDAICAARRLGYFFSLLDLPAVTSRLCARAIEEGIEADHAREIIRRRGLVPDKTPLHLEKWPWFVKITTLGSFDILREEESVRFGRKRPQKPLQLLKLIIALGGEAVAEAKIADALWPDADGDAAHQALKTTLHRLRKIIGRENTIAKKGRRITLNRRYIWTDLWAFEALERKVAPFTGEATPTDEDTQKWVRNCRRALDLYRGSFLADENWSPLIIAKCEEVRGRFIRIVERLGRHLEASGQWFLAAEHYEKAIIRENGVEVFYSRLMNCYINLGRTAEAKLAYERYRSVLAASLNIEPSPAMTHFYNTLKNNNG